MVDPKFYGSFASNIQRAINNAHILKRVLEDGNIKIYEDEKGLAHRTEISLEKGKVDVYKIYEPSRNFWRYKKIEVYNHNEDLIGTIDVFTDMTILLRPSHKFTFGSSMIGTGKGDIEMVIAHYLLKTPMDPRLSAQASVDPQVFEMIDKMLLGKEF